MEVGGEQFARLERFAELLAERSAGVPLDRAALAIAAVLRSRDVDGTLTTLDELAAGVPEPTFEALRRHLYDDLGFGGPTGEYDDPRHSMLDLVVAHRRGLPILLATVMIEVGRRAGVPVVGIGMPMHFLVRSAGDPEAFVDPVTGDAFDRAGARRRFDAMTAGRLPWDDRHLAPTGSRLIVVRMLTNLRASYERRQRPRPPGARRPDAGQHGRAAGRGRRRRPPERRLQLISLLEDSSLDRLSLALAGPAPGADAAS